MSRFGDLVKKLRIEKAMTLETVAKKIGSHKGYVSGIENDKVNPPSVKIIKKYAKVLGQDARSLARLAWVDKAPEILREDAEEFLKWCQSKVQSPIATSKGQSAETTPSASSSEPPAGPLR